MSVRLSSVVLMLLAGAVAAQNYCSVDPPSTCSVLGPGHPGHHSFE